MNERLTKSGFTLLDEGIRTQWEPGEDVIKSAVTYGNEIIEKLKEAEKEETQTEA